MSKAGDGKRNLAVPAGRLCGLFSIDEGEKFRALTHAISSVRQQSTEIRKQRHDEQQNNAIVVLVINKLSIEPARNL